MIKRPENISDDIEFEDSEGYRSTDGITSRDIILNQFKRCISEGSKDLTAESGVFNRIINGELVEVMVPNQKEIFMNHIEMLKISLLDKFEENKEPFGKYINEFDNNIMKLSNDHITAINQIQERYRNKLHKPEFNTQYNLEIKSQKNYYENMQIAIYKKLLVGISLLIGHLRYFEEEG